jgi:hypothetical protein
MMASPFVKDEKVVCAEALIATGCRSDDSDDWSEGEVG